MLQCFVLCGWCSHFPAEFGSTFIEGIKHSELASISKMTQWSLCKWEDFKHLTLLLTFLLSQMQMLGNINSFLSCHFKILKGPLIIQWPVKHLSVRKKVFFLSFCDGLTGFKSNTASFMWIQCITISPPFSSEKKKIPSIKNWSAFQTNEKRRQKSYKQTEDRAMNPTSYIICMHRAHVLLEGLKNKF